jgi:Ner family transcriptional regulator
MKPINGKTTDQQADGCDFKCVRQRNAWIGFQLKRRGKSFASLARENGFSRSSVAVALYRPSLKMESILANELGISPDQLFPERYQDGVRIDGRRVCHA